MANRVRRPTDTESATKSVRLKKDRSFSLCYRSTTTTDDLSLHEAISNKSVELLRIILAVDSVDVNIESKEGTPLHYAIREGQEDIVKLLLADPRVDIDLPLKDGVTALALAVHHCPNLVSLLLRKGAKVNAASTAGVTPLHIAVEKGLEKVVEVLLKNGASVNQQDHAGFTPLSLALHSNNLDIIKRLCSAGAASSLTDQYGRTGLEQATSDQARELLKSCVDYKRCLQLAENPEGPYITSLTLPYHADYVPGGILKLPKLGIGVCPGENLENLRRDVPTDVQSLKEDGTQVLVTLLQLKELQEMGCTALFSYLKRDGIQSLWFPLMDRWIPDSMSAFVGAVKGIEQEMLKGKHVVVHCNSSRRRSRMVVVAVLMALGLTSTEALNITRNNSFDNPAQVLFLKLFKKSWQEDVTIPRAPRPSNLSLSLSDQRLP